MYSAKVLQQFQNERYVGDLSNADAYAQRDNPACGDVLRISLRVEHGRVVDVRFRARGCVATIACGAQLAEMIAGATLIHARNIASADLVQALGGLPPASVHAAALAIDTLRSALAQLPIAAVAVAKQ